MEDLATASDLVQLGGFDLIGLQELGGCQDIPTNKWDTKTVSLQGQSFTVLVGSPPDSHRSLGICFPCDLLPSIVHVTILPCGLCIKFRIGGVSTYAVCMHLPYTNRDDSRHVWQAQMEALREVLLGARYHDNIFVMSDLNYELIDLTAEMVDERSTLLHMLVRDLGLSHTRPNTFTWSNTRGSSSRIDYILYRTPHQQTCEEQVVDDSDHILPSDHRLCTLCVLQKGLPKRKRQKRTNCGKWLVDYTKAIPALNRLASKADLEGQDLAEQDFLIATQKARFRPKGLRFQDPPELRQLIQERKAMTDPLTKRKLGRDIVSRRADLKKRWRTSLLDRAASGDYQVISYFRRKQGAHASQLEYSLRCGGSGPAVGGLKAFYRDKYDPVDIQHMHDPLALYKAQVGSFMPAPALVTKEELEQVLLQTKSRKSCGQDGAPYELWCAVLQSEAADHLVDFVNRILLEDVDFPDEWLNPQIVLLPKVKEPKHPKDFRPIVLAATLSKLVTKVFLVRLRDRFPPMPTGQLSAQKGAQSLDGSVALKHLVHLSRQWGLPLLACKLDIQAAFDSLSHAALAKFLASLGPLQESKLLLDMVTRSQVCLSFAGQTWRQRLRRGILQGSSFSAELFARALDHYLSPLIEEWEKHEPTWIRDCNGKPMYVIIYADDLLVLATDAMQLTRLLNQLQDSLQAIGLQLARHKCQYIRSPDLPPTPVKPHRFEKPLEEVTHFVFLGILIGFAVTCQMTLAARLRMASNSFFGYMGFLSRCRGGLTKRLHLLNSFVTSRWRWLSAAVRPLWAVSQQLRTLQTHFLMSMTRLPPDPLQTPSENWISRRRGAKMAAQSCGHRPWDSVHLEAFLGYWGHAARIPEAANRPIKRVMQIRDETWRITEAGSKRKKGRWPNAVFGLALLWRRCRQHGDSMFWEGGAQDRQRWKQFVHEIFAIKGLLPDRFFPDLHEVDLCHRCLLRTGDRFWLLPQTHPPIDPPYPSSFKHVQDTEEVDEVSCFTFACDGSRKGTLLGAGVAVLPPYGEIPKDAILCGFPVRGAPATNIRAELVGATKALEMCLQLMTKVPEGRIVLLTDSAYVLQVLEGGTVGFAHVSLQAGLCMLWHKCSDRVRIKHVRSHSGHALNELADQAAKAALTFPGSHFFVRTADYNRAFVPEQGAQIPDLLGMW